VYVVKWVHLVKKGWQAQMAREARMVLLELRDHQVHRVPQVCLVNLDPQDLRAMLVHTASKVSQGPRGPQVTEEYVAILAPLEHLDLQVLVARMVLTVQLVLEECQAHQAMLVQWALRGHLVHRVLMVPLAKSVKTAQLVRRDPRELMAKQANPVLLGKAFRVLRGLQDLLVHQGLRPWTSYFLISKVM